jgi:hypothetical protein
MTAKNQNCKAVPSQAELAALGRGEMAYVKAIRSEEFRRIFPDSPELPPGLDLFALLAADGSPILITDEHATAVENAAEHELTTVSLH